MFDFKCLILLCLGCYFISGANAGAVSFIHPCHWNDAACILESSKKALPFIVKGSPDLEMEPLDPLVIKEVINGDTGDLKLKFSNLTVERLHECELIKVERPEKLIVFLEVVCPIKAFGQYNLSGKLFELVVTGHGDFQITTEKLRFSISVPLKELNKDGKVYYKLGSFDYKYEPEEKVDYDFKNLFDGDKTQSELLLKLLDENWKETFTGFGGEVLKKVVTKVVLVVKNLFIKTSAEELELS